MKCFLCLKKLTFLDTQTNKCYCEKIFCDKHKISHNCDFDYKSIKERKAKAIFHNLY